MFFDLKPELKDNVLNFAYILVGATWSSEWGRAIFTLSQFEMHISMARYYGYHNFKDGELWYLRM